MQNGVAPFNGQLPLRDYLDFRFGVLEGIIKEDRTETKAILKDHEDRIRCQEKESIWKWIAQAVVGVLAVIGIGTK